jgi:hypothetical protein
MTRLRVAPLEVPPLYFQGEPAAEIPLPGRARSGGGAAP